MPEIQLGYGNTVETIEYDPDRFAILRATPFGKALSDAAVGERLENPNSGARLSDVAVPGETVLIVVPDATRSAACPQIVNLLVRRVIESGTAPGDISVIFSTGIHRPVTPKEKAELLTPFIARRIKMLDHRANDLAQFVRLGQTSGGIPVELNRALIEHDRVILIGGVAFHYFAGFTGGRKLVCPGLASSRTIAETHKLAFDFDRLARREGVGPGILGGNAVHEAFLEAAGMVNITYCINAMVNDSGEAVEVICGDWVESHRAACVRFAEAQTVKISEKREIVVASCGGFPRDINMIQANKALQAAALACKPGGTILLLAECREGPGRSDFLDWFAAGNSRALAERLRENYKVNGQTAWSLLKAAEEFRIIAVSSLSRESLSAMRLKKAESLESALGGLDKSAKGYIIPRPVQTRL